MSLNFRSCLRFKNRRRGAILPLVGAVFVILLIAAVFAIDIAYVHVTRAELRTATDAAARAAVEALGREQSRAAAVDAALAVARENQVAGVGLTLDPSEIIFGVASLEGDGSFGFQPEAQANRPVNSVQVTGSRKSDSPNGPVGFLFGPLFGITSFQPEQTAIAARSDRDISLVLDISGSMRQFGRMNGLRNALTIFLQELAQSQQDVRVSLVVYSNSSQKLVPLTADLGLIQSTFAPIEPFGLTAIGEGLADGLDSVLNDPRRRPFAEKAILLMTDGNHNRGVRPDVIARRCADAGVQVHTVTFSQGANQQLMIDVANLSNGTHSHAVSNQQLEEVFRRIAQQFRVLLIR